MRAHTPLTERQVSNLIKDESEARTESELGTYIPYQSLKYTTSIEGKNKKEKELRDILDALIPPKSNPQNTDEILYASLEITTREEIKKQWKTLDFILQLRQARETGICPIREQVYSNMFDELIRQETINCPERGLMLQRCRNEAKMTLRAYETLYETNLGYGARKGLEANMTLEEIKNNLTEVLNQKESSLHELEALKAKYDLTEKRLQDETALKNKEYQGKKDFHNEQKQNLESFLKTYEEKQQ